jgi:hypothetical protein
LCRQRRDREIKPLQPRGGQAEDQADCGRNDARERNAEEDGNAEPVREIGRGKGAEAEEGGVADRNLAGEADNDVQPKGCDAEDANLDQEAENVFVDDVRRKAHQHDACDHGVAAGRGREYGGIRRIAGAEIAGGNEGLACHDCLDPLDVFGAEQAVWLDHQDDDERIERRDLVEIAPVQIFAVEKMREVFQEPDDDAA